MSKQKRVIIVGAGMAGLIAHQVFSSSNYTVKTFEAAPSSPLSNHKAVFRVRDPNIRSILQCDLERVDVDKAVFFCGSLQSSFSIESSNLYSLKLYRSIEPRSLQSLGSVKRYLMSNIKVPNSIYYGRRLTSITHSRTEDQHSRYIAHFTKDIGEKTTEETVEYDFLISTIPLPNLLRCADVTCDIPLDCHPIFIIRGTLPWPSTVNQTIYFPDPNFKIYRATIQSRTFIAEGILTCAPVDGVVERCWRDEGGMVLGAFGLEINPELLKDTSTHIQRFGKILPTGDEEERKRIIYNLTSSKRILSLGRHAIWKPIRTDHLLEDVRVVKKIVDMSTSDHNYFRRKEGV
jgi:hypothetical protein